MPLTGGATDKAGNSYERRWTVFAMLDILDGRSQSIRIEVPGDPGAGAEFRATSGGVPAWHQAKRQRDGGPWTIANMAAEGVLAPMWLKIQDGGRCVFVSSTGAQELRELVERATDAEDWAEFEREFLTAQQNPRFQRLRSAWGDPPEEAVYGALRDVDVQLIGEPELAGYVEARLSSLVKGGPSTAAAVLAQLADDSRHRELTSVQILQWLATNGIEPRNLAQDVAVAAHLKDTVELYLGRLRPLYIDGRELPRAEAADAFERLTAGDRVLVTGAAGHGKSVIAGQVTQLARAAGWTILVLSADRLPHADTLFALGQPLGLPDSPVTVLAGAGGDHNALLVLDQLDAVSVASGRYPERISVIQDLVGEAARHPSMRVLLACRQFDLDNDRELRSVAADERTVAVKAGPLDPQVVVQTLADAGLASALPPRLIAMLTVPLHLAIYVEIAHVGADVSGIGTLTELYDRYWDVKRAACRASRDGTDEWLPVVDRLVDYMSAEQRLAIPIPALDDLALQVAVMSSENVLVSENRALSFFHETFFDYCFARRFVAGGGDLRNLLVSTEQNLFRRAQVRQLLAYQRASDFTSYRADFVWLLTTPEVRTHLKALVVALASTIADPQPAEWAALRPIAADPEHPLHNRVWQALRRNPAWFPLLRDAGEWNAWLTAADLQVVDRALWAMSGMANDYPAEVVNVLGALPSDEACPRRLRGFLRVTGAHADRVLFELLLAALDAGYYDNDQGHDLWFVIHDLAENQPEWGVKVVSALLSRALGGGAEDPFKDGGPLSADRQSLSDQVVKALANAAPATFVEQLLPQILEVARRNARPEWSGGDVVLDAVWGMHVYRAGIGLSHDLYDGMVDALRALAVSEPAKAATAFAALRADVHEAAWFLLALGYSANPTRFADDAADWLAQTPGALHLGYSDAPHWVSRGLVAAITTHCDDEHLRRVVDIVIGYTPPFERTYDALRFRGQAALCLLNGVDAARLPEGASRRLAELRRKFLRDDIDPPRGITGGFVPPPIPEDRARKMTDTQWLKAMARHSKSDISFRGGGVIGDAYTQAQVLESLAREAPERFARLLLRLPDDVAEPYVGAILRGVAGARLDGDLIRDVCVRALQLGGSDTNRWVVRLVESEAATTLADELLDMIAAIAAGDPGPPRDMWLPTDDDPTEYYGGDPDGAGLNCTRGAAAGAIGGLISEDPGRLPRLSTALESACADPTVQVRAMAVASLAHVLVADAELALHLFDRCVGSAEEALLASRWVERFLNLAVRRGHYPQVSHVLARMQASSSADVRRAAARQLAVASYRDPDLDAAVDAALASDDTTRAGVVEVFAENPTAGRHDRRQAVLAHALDDPAAEVRAAAVRSFYGMESEQIDHYVPLIRALAESPALHEHAGPLFHSLESLRQPLPVAVLELCERFVEAHATDLGDIATAAAGDAMSITQLVVRLHAQHDDPDTRRRCLDLIDQLVVLNVHGIDDDLSAIER